MSAEQDVTDLHARINALADLAAEHMNCSGCPTPWWLTNWLASEVSSRPDGTQDIPAATDPDPT